MSYDKDWYQLCIINCVPIPKTQAFPPPSEEPYAGRAGNRKVINHNKIIHMTVLDLKGIAGAGGSIILNAQNYTPLDLKGIASVGKQSGATLIIKGANKLTSLDCKGIASCNPGHVIFDFA